MTSCPQGAADAGCLLMLDRKEALWVFIGSARTPSLYMRVKYLHWLMLSIVSMPFSVFLLKFCIVLIFSLWLVLCLLWASWGKTEVDHCSRDIVFVVLKMLRVFNLSTHVYVRTHGCIMNFYLCIVSRNTNREACQHVLLVLCVGGGGSLCGIICCVVILMCLNILHRTLLAHNFTPYGTFCHSVILYIPCLIISPHTSFIPLFCHFTFLSHLPCVTVISHLFHTYPDWLSPSHTNPTINNVILRSHNCYRSHYPHLTLTFPPPGTDAHS